MFNGLVRLAHNALTFYSLGGQAPEIRKLTEYLNNMLGILTQKENLYEVVSIILFIN